MKVETEAHLCFLRKVGALWVCIWNQGGGGPKSLGTTSLTQLTYWKTGS
jgi:hypothetical protein